MLGVLGALVLYGCSNPQLIRRRHRAAVYNTELGIAYLQRGALALAKARLDQAERENPDSPNVQSARALLFERLREPARADRAFRRALDLAPHDPDYQNDYAVYLCSTGHYARGVKYFLEAARNPLYLTPATPSTMRESVCARNIMTPPRPGCSKRRSRSIRDSRARSGNSPSSITSTAG
ncbi:type IV pilus biogenesis/stability protein PilW [mine drainage metagenome]|uniref:Type IV pilus biogenesis/stability protein PilW n=1 Tax=mine drainage metagenome TaxID=410659 RepID=T0YEH3_9ZZZZ